MKLKDYIKFFKDNTSIKDILLIILSIISIIIWISGTVFAVEEEISWSSTNQAITDAQLKNAVSNAVTDVTNENFYNYTPTNNNWSYENLMTRYLGINTYSKAFISSGDDGFYFLTAYNKFQMNYQNSSIYKEYYYGLNSTTMYYFDINNKTISNVIFGGQYTPLNNLGWDWTKTDITKEEFETTAYKQNLLYNTFFLLLGPVYDNVNTTELLNYTISYKIDGNVYENEQYTGEIVFSDEFESWQTRNLSSNFLNSGDTFSYYVHGLNYSESGIAVNSSFKVKISDVNFNGDSVYLPSVTEVNNAIKQAEGYMNYAYVITLTIDDVLLLRSDVFIVDAKPIVMIPYFRLKYDYIYYGSYIDIGGTSSGDPGGVITPGGDDTNLEGGISGIWQAIVDLPKNFLEGLVGLFVPSSDYFYNEGPENPGLWQRMSIYFQSKLGFLYDVIVFIPNLLLSITDMIENVSETWSITIPDLTLPALTGVEEFTFLEGFEWSPYDWVNSRIEFRNLYDLYLNIIDLFIYWSLIWLSVDTLFGFLNIRQVTVNDVSDD